MSEKQTQQHRQHFNLSEETKQKLEELTARRYPGKQRRQSQLVEDLITEAFAKEYGMSMVSSGMQEPEPGPGRLAPLTHEAIGLARQQAQRMKAREVYPEHLLLGLIEQSDSSMLKALSSLQGDLPAIRNRLILSERPTGAEEPGEDLTLSQESRECIDWAKSIAKRMHSALVQPYHLFWGVLLNKRIQDTLAPLLPSPEIFGGYAVGQASAVAWQPDTCPHCKRVVQAQWKHCVYCGKSLAKVCLKCGTPRAEIEGVRFCFECGSPLE